MVDTTRGEDTPNSGDAAAPNSVSVPLLAWYAVLTFCIAQIVSTIDRGMLALVIDPVRSDLQITEIQIALLQGFAFAAFYVSAGLPMGLLADRVNRRRLLIIGIVVWSLATIAGGLAQNFGQMFASRLLIGIGEAVLAPCAVTMIADFFPANARGLPMSVYVFGSLIAYGLGSLLTGYILQLAPQGAFDFIAPLSGLAPWRIAFVLFGIAGFLVIALILGLREPVRRVSAAGAELQIGGVGSTLAHFWAQRRLFVPMYLSLAMFAMGASVANNWGAVLLTRQFGFGIAAAGKTLGTAQIVWAALGMLAAAWIVDRVAARAGSSGKVGLAALLSLAAIPSSLAVFAASGDFAVVLLAELMFVIAIFGTTMLSVIPEVTPIGTRGFAIALYSFFMTMIGGSIGPVLVAYLTEKVFRDKAAVGSSMAVVGVLAFLLAAFLLALTARAVRAAVARAD